jgi:mannose-6-phosphate isomerase-like protein (cupin superfamily)
MSTGTSATNVIDFNPTVGMEIDGAPPEDPDTEPWRVISVFAAGFPGPPLHAHPHMEERFEVLSGVLDIYLDGNWREVRTGETITVPAETPHTVRNLHEQEVRMRNMHAPALEFPNYIASPHELVTTGKVRSLPPRDLRSVIYLAMLFAAHEHTLISIKPPQRLMRALAFIGARCGYRLPGSSAPALQTFNNPEV